MVVGSRDFYIRLVTFLGGIYFFLEFVLPEEFLGVKIGAYHEQITLGVTAIGALVFGLGLINLLRYHGSKIIFRRKGALPGAALLISMFAMMYLTAAEWYQTELVNNKIAKISNLGSFIQRIEDDFKGDQDTAKLDFRISKLLSAAQQEISNSNSEIPSSGETSDWKEVDRNFSVGIKSEYSSALEAIKASSAKFGTLTDNETKIKELTAMRTSIETLRDKQRELLMLQFGNSQIKQLYQLLYDGLFIPLGSAMFSLLGFYIASAAYRAFRVRSFESSLMMTAAILVMLGQIPFGVWLWDGFPGLRQWLLEVPNSAAFRAIKFGASIALLVMAFRMWFSIESEKFTDSKSSSGSVG